MCGRVLCGPGYHHGFLPGLLWIAVFAGFIALVAWAVARLVAHDHHRMAARPLSPPPAGGWVNPPDDALNVARMRYARGELDRDQYFRVVEDLTGQRPPAGSAYPAPSHPAPAYPGPTYPTPAAPGYPPVPEPPAEPPTPTDPPPSAI